ncbi:unnamed protein product [Ilex paraguariensis]|uniref:RNase H type-1 domain-containing protein n=1 Tax=Ilex paraguariensis TaxID=185542 RepID=A0ABC8RK11_9AQUA
MCYLFYSKKAKEQGIRNFINILGAYCVASGQCLNYMKSADPVIPPNCRRHDIILNCDGIFKKGKAAIGVVVRYSNGCIVDGFGAKVLASSSVQAKAFAVREACPLATAT